MTKDEAIEWFEVTIQLCHSQGEALKAMKTAIEALKHGVNTEDLVARIKQAEPFNNPDCPQWVLNIIKGSAK